jgi:hypothetical protein
VLSDEVTVSLPDTVEDTVCVVVDSAPESWDATQRRITFADETLLHASTRHTLLPTHHHIPAHAAVSHRIVDQDNVDFPLVKTWITHCQTEHAESCSFRNITGSQPSPRNPGFKVIDCLTRQIITANMNVCSYIALSYVWGKPSSNEPEVAAKPGFLPPNLPNTIEDMLKVIISLGFQFLWIDKYCIDQSSTEDKRTQVTLMDTIYQAATLTIIAAGGPTSHSGLPGLSHPRTVPKTLQLDRTPWIASRADPKTAVKQSTWFTRGWT